MVYAPTHGMLSRLVPAVAAALFVAGGFGISSAGANVLSITADTNVTSGASLFPFAPPVVLTEPLAPSLALEREISGQLIPGAAAAGTWSNSASAQYGTLSAMARAATSAPLGYGAETVTTASWQDALLIGAGGGTGFLWLDFDLSRWIDSPGFYISYGWSVNSGYCERQICATWGNSGATAGTSVEQDTLLAVIPFYFGEAFTYSSQVFAVADAFGGLSTEVGVNALLRNAWVTTQSYVPVDDVIYTLSGVEYATFVPLTSGEAPEPATQWLLAAGLLAGWRRLARQSAA